MVAARQVQPALNAAAISGEYLSAASFLGIAGLVVAQGLGLLTAQPQCVRQGDRVVCGQRLRQQAKGLGSA